MEQPVSPAPGWGKRLPGDLLKRWPRDEKGEPETPAFLCHCSGVDMDETMTVSRMDFYGIPCLVQYPNDGSFGKLILGLSGTGADIFVPASLVEDARELLKDPEEIEEEESHELS